MSRPQLRVFPPLSPTVYARRGRAALPFPLDDQRCRTFALARHGLLRGVERLGLRPGDEVLTPAYHHGSEVEAYASAGLVPRFYDATDTLEPDPDELDRAIGERVRALHLIHYLGFPSDAARWRRWCDERRLFLIEDAAQAWLARRDGAAVGSLGDLAIFSLYKSVGVPDGGAVVASVPIPPPGGGRRLAARRVAKAHRSWLAQRSPKLASPRSARPAPERDRLPPGEFALGDPDSPSSALTEAMLPRLLRDDVAGRRRRNYASLLERLGEVVPQPFADVRTGASPFAFPVAVADKRSLLDALAAAGIRALDLWSVPHPSLPVERFPGAARRRRSTVGLPVHQELSPAHVDAIGDAVAGYLRSDRPR
jgi:dTDP-4-amino-4,6-dideoxygalactose transaminase